MNEYMKHRLALKNGTATPVKNEPKPIAAISEKKKAADKAARPQKVFQKIAKVSDKRKVANRVYKKIVKEMAAESMMCELKSPVG